jgi:hypothetical protein
VIDTSVLKRREIFRFGLDIFARRSYENCPGCSHIRVLSLVDDAKSTDEGEDFFDCRKRSKQSRTVIAKKKVARDPTIIIDYPGVSRKFSCGAIGLTFLSLCLSFSLSEVNRETTRAISDVHVGKKTSLMDQSG